MQIFTIDKRTCPEKNDTPSPDNILMIREIASRISHNVCNIYLKSKNEGIESIKDTMSCLVKLTEILSKVKGFEQTTRILEMHIMS